MARWCSLVLALLSGCPPSIGPCPRTADCFDAGPRDAAAHDAFTPACSDAPSDPCWARMQDLPAPCDVWRAQHPERIVFPTPTDCGPGCRRMDLGSAWMGFRQGGWTRGDGDGYVALFGGDPSAGAYQIIAVVRTDGRTVFATRYPVNGIVPGTRDSLCRAARYEIGGDDGAFVVDWCFDPDCRDAGERLYDASLDALASVAAPVAASPDLGGLALAVSHRGVVWSGGGVIDGSRVSFGPGASFPRLVDADVLWIDDTDALHVWSSGTDTVLAQLPPASSDTPVATDGTSIVWTELTFDGGGDATATLRAAPFVHSAAAFAPRTLEGPRVLSPAGVMGDGLYAYEESTPAAGSTPAALVGYRVIDVATGTARRFVLPDGEHARYLHLVTARQLVVEADDDALAHHLYFVDPTTLPIVM